jgi:hypothetical protein
MCGHDLALDQTSLYWTQTTDFFAVGPGQVRTRGK